jgi:hypothetical protein
MTATEARWAHWGAQRLPQPRWAARGYRKCIRFARARFFFVWRWTLRMALLGLLLLSGTAIYWLWCDNVYGSNWTTIVGGAFLAIVAGTLGLWFFASLLFDDTL